MFRITIVSGKAYAVDIGDDFRDVSEDELENIHIFATESTPVVIVGEIEDLEILGINLDVEVVQ